MVFKSVLFVIESLGIIVTTTIRNRNGFWGHFHPGYFS